MSGLCEWCNTNYIGDYCSGVNCMIFAKDHSSKQLPIPLTILIELPDAIPEIQLMHALDFICKHLAGDAEHPVPYAAISRAVTWLKTKWE